MFLSREHSNRSRIAALTDLSARRPLPAAADREQVHLNNAVNVDRERESETKSSRLYSAAILNRAAGVAILPGRSGHVPLKCPGRGQSPPVTPEERGLAQFFTSRVTEKFIFHTSLAGGLCPCKTTQSSYKSVLFQLKL